MADDDELARKELFGSVFALAQHLTRRADAALEPLGLTTRQWLLLAVLTEVFAGRDASLTEAAARYGSSRQNVKQIALQLEARGFLRLEPDPADGRTTRLVLTDKVRVFDERENRERGEALLDAAYAGLPAADVRRLRDLVRRWVALLETGAVGQRSSRPGSRKA